MQRKSVAFLIYISPVPFLLYGTIFQAKWFGWDGYSLGLEGQFLKGTGQSAYPIHMVGTSKVVLVVKNWPANSGDARNADLIHGSGISPGVRNEKNLLQNSYLENSMGRRAWQATVHEVAKSQTQLSD